MKVINLEIEKLDSENYPYGQRFILKQDQDDIFDIYEKGFLPVFIKQSNKVNMVFYLNRSIRVDLEKFEMSSENRRIMRKTDYLNFKIKDLKVFEYDPIKVGKFCHDNFRKRFPYNPMHISKVKRIFTSGINTHVFVYYLVNNEFKKKVEPIGYATGLVTKEIIHYTFPFMDVNYFKQNLGMGMMLRAVIWAKENNKKYIYLGTCNKPPAFYKLQFKGVEWYDGQKWDENIKKLKQLIR